MRTTMSSLFLTVVLLGLGPAVSAAPAAAPHDLTSGNPAAIVDLSTPEGLRLVSGTWKYSDARVVPADNRAAGADLRPSGKPVKTLDVVPHAGAAGFDDSGWQTAGNLEQRRGNGKLSFGWYRLQFTVPERIGSVSTRARPSCSRSLSTTTPRFGSTGGFPQCSVRQAEASSRDSTHPTASRCAT